MSEVHKEAIKEKIILKGMTKKEVEYIHGKGKLTQIQGTPAYLYASQLLSAHTDWYVIYDEKDVVIWAYENKYDTYAESQKNKIEVEVKPSPLQNLYYLNELGK